MLLPIPYMLPAAALVRQTAAPTVERQVLSSGLHLFVVERPDARLTAIEIRIRGAGPVNETPETNGVAHAIEHMVFKGTATKPAGSFDAELERMGGEASAQTVRDGAIFRVTVLPDRTSDALHLLAEMLTKPAFREADWDNERTVVRGEMRVAQSETQKLGFQTLAATAFPEGDPYRMPLMGTPENVARFSAADLQAFHKRWYRPVNITVAVVGPVISDQVRSIVDGLFPAPYAPLTDTAKPALPPSGKEPLDGEVRAAPLADDAQTSGKLATAFLAFRAPRLSTDPAGAATSDVLAAMLVRGGTGGVLGRRLFSGGPSDALGDTANYVPQERRGLFTISVTAERPDIGHVEDDIVTALDDLTSQTLAGDDKDGRLSGELEAAKQSVLADVRFRRQTVDGEAQYLAGLDMLDAPADFADRYEERVRAVSIADIEHLLARYVTPTRRAVAVIGLSEVGPATKVGFAP